MQVSDCPVVERFSLPYNVHTRRGRGRAHVSAYVLKVEGPGHGYTVQELPLGQDVRSSASNGDLEEVEQIEVGGEAPGFGWSPVTLEPQWEILILCLNQE